MNTSNYSLPTDGLRFKTIDMHTGGEPLRVIVEGIPPLEGKTVLENRNILKNQYDYIRKVLMWEPRGHADMYGCILTPSNDDQADFGIIFLHNEGYSTMCGHATIAITKLAVEAGWVEKGENETKVVIDAPCGRLISFAKMHEGKVESVRFQCVPSYVVALDQEIHLSQFGKVKYDLAYGGAYYAYVDAGQFGLDLSASEYMRHIQLGMEIKHEVMRTSKLIQHPYETDLSFLYGTIFIGAPLSGGIDSRNVCVFAEGEVDRCPTGSGVSGRMAIHYKRKEIEMHESMTIESITGSVFRGKVIETCKFGDFDAVIPEVEGNAFVTGINEFYVDPKDLFKEGFFLR